MMGADSEIAWTDHTFNPWVGCSRVSPGCQNCYAEALDQRWAKGQHWGKTAARRVTSEANWRKPLAWERAAAEAGRPALVFCASMADVFEDRDDLHSPRRDLFDLMEETTSLIWLVLTKRPENVLRLVRQSWVPGTEDGCTVCGEFPLDHVWPENVWIGTTVEDQQRADERIPALLGIPAPVRFLSCEPLLGPLDLSRWLDPPKLRGFTCSRPGDAAARLGLPTIDWIIAGGESGNGFRPLDVGHARSVQAQARRAAVPFFFKQHGGRTPKAGGDLLDGVRYHAWPDAARRAAYQEQQ